jgi:hypothetical protein
MPVIVFKLFNCNFFWPNTFSLFYSRVHYLQHWIFKSSIYFINRVCPKYVSGIGMNVMSAYSKSIFWYVSTHTTCLIMVTSACRYWCAKFSIQNSIYLYPKQSRQLPYRYTVIYTVSAFLDSNLKKKICVLQTFLCRFYSTNVVTFQDGRLSVINYRMFNEDRHGE